MDGWVWLGRLAGITFRSCSCLVYVFFYRICHELVIVDFKGLGVPACVAVSGRYPAPTKTCDRSRLALEILLIGVILH